MRMMMMMTMMICFLLCAIRRIRSISFTVSSWRLAGYTCTFIRFAFGGKPGTCCIRNCFVEPPRLTLRYPRPMLLSFGWRAAVYTTAKPAEAVKGLAVRTQRCSHVSPHVEISWHSLCSKAFIVSNCRTSIAEVSSHQSAVYTGIRRGCFFCSCP